jgi:acetolactate synthase-1/2/3 large subunit
VGEADVVLVVGSKLGATDTAFENADLLDATRQQIVQIDIEPRHASWTYPAEVMLIGDAGQVLDDLAAALDGRVSADVVAQRKGLVQAARQRHGFFNDTELISDATPVLPQRVIHELQSLLPDDAIVTGDAGENRLFMTHYFQTKAPGMFLQSAGIGAMGYAIPAALAAKLVHPDRPVVAVCGDGGFAIGMNGLMTAIEEDVPIVVVVFNNNALGWVKHGQGDRNIASEFATFDHGAIARAMGCDGVRVEAPAGVAPALRDALASGRPSVVDVHTSIDETYLKVTSPLVGKGG